MRFEVVVDEMRYALPHPRNEQVHFPSGSARGTQDPVVIDAFLALEEDARTQCLLIFGRSVPVDPRPADAPHLADFLVLHHEKGGAVRIVAWQGNVRLFRLSKPMTGYGTFKLELGGPDLVNRPETFYGLSVRDAENVRAILTTWGANETDSRVKVGMA